MALGLLWLQLGGTAVVILAASHYMAKSADIIAFKTGLGRTFIGVVLLATATSLPELGTGISSVTWLNEPDLAAGDAFGSNLFNLLIIGLLDIFWRQGPILNSVSTTSILIGVLGIVVISLAAAAVLIHGMTATMATWYISPISLLLFVVFLIAIYMIYRFDQSKESADDWEDSAHDYTAASSSRTTLTYLLSAAVVVGAAIWLAQTGDSIADEMGWEASYVGTQFLAFSTSLPELAASFAAIRLKAPELAITNVLGSNLFNMGFVLFLDDVAYTDGALWEAIAGVHSLTAVIAVFMTAVVVIALILRPRRRPGRFWTVESLLLIGLYLAASVLVFTLA